MRITGLHQKAPKGEKRKKSSLELGRPCPILILTVCNLMEIMHNSDLKHLEFEEFNNKFMLVSIL